MALASIAGRDHVAGQSEQLHQLDLVIADVDFPPSMLHRGSGWVFVMIVVPAFADGQHSDQPIVATVFTSFVIAITEHVAERIHGPGDVPDADDANNRSPYNHARAQLRGGCQVAARSETDQCADQKVNGNLTQDVEELQVRIGFESHVERIAQKILCELFQSSDAIRLPIDVHQPTHVRPKEIDAWAVRIWNFIGVNVMHAMNGDPTSWRVFHAADADDRDDVFHPFRRLEAAMSQQTVITDRDALSENVDTNDAKR